MKEETILKLLASTNEQDILLAISFISKLEDSRRFFKKHGKIINEAVGEDNFGKRYYIPTNLYMSETIYHKMKDSLYILTRDYARDICECYDNYDKKYKVIDYTQ